MVQKYIEKHPYIFMVVGTLIVTFVLFGLVYGILTYVHADEKFARTCADTICGICGIGYFSLAGIYLMKKN